MPVVDKYRPVQATPHTVTPWHRVWAGAVGLGVVLALLSPDTLERTAVFEEGLPEGVRTALHGVVSVSEATGLAGLRRGLDDLSAPLDDAARWFTDEPAEPGTTGGEGGEDPAETSLESPPPPEEAATPRERWAAAPKPPAPSRVLLVGASSIQFALGTELERLLNERYEGLEVERKGKLSTGLTRDDVFDWPAEIAERMARFRPDLVVGQFGGNDAQTILSPTTGRHRFGTEGWDAEYTRRLTALVTEVEARGAEMIVLGMPVMREAGFDRRMDALNALTARVVTAAGGDFLDTRPLSSDAQGEYTASVRVDGRTGRMRMDDGVHFTRMGGQHMAAGVARMLERTVRLVPAAPEADPGVRPAPAVRLTVPGTVREDTPALAFVPRDVPEDGLPVWVLLHGAWDDWTAWSEHAHADLQRLAAEHRMVIVLPDGEPFGWYLDGTVDPEHRLATWFHDDLLPFLHDTLPSSGVAAVSGLSMGGHGALTLAMQRPERFVAATSMSGVVDLTAAASREALQATLGPYAEHPADWEARSAIHQVRADPSRIDALAVMLTVGRDDRWFPANEALHGLLQAEGVDHTWDPVDGGHTWTVWTEALPRHAAFVARALHGAEARPPAPAPAPGPTDAE